MAKQLTVDLTSFESSRDFDLDVDNLFDAFKKSQKSDESAEIVFRALQRKVLDYVTRKGYLKSYLETEKISVSVRGNPKYLKSDPRSPKRRAIQAKRLIMAPLYGYGPHATEIIANSGINLSSTNHWRKASLLRWLRVYEYCTRRAKLLSINRMGDWAEAAKTIDERSGYLSIWDILEDTD